MAWQILTELAGISISYLSGISSPPTDNIQSDVLVLGQNSSAWTRGDASSKTWNVGSKLQINTSINSSERTTYCSGIETGHVFMNATGGGGSSVKRADTCFWIDEINERAYCVGACATDYGNTWIMYPNISVAYQEELYQIINGLVPPSYTWLGTLLKYNLSTCIDLPGELPDPISEANIVPGNSPISQFNKSQPFSASWDVTEHLRLECGVTNQRYGKVIDVENNVQLFGGSGGNSPSMSATDLLIAIDHNAKEAYMVFIYKFSAYTGYYWIVDTGNQAKRQRFYTLLQEAVTPTYQWQSVPMVSGKNGILSLSTLNDINDGNPVTTSDTNKFYLEKTSNLLTLINNAINS